MAAHHDGFIELFVRNVDKCPDGDILDAVSRKVTVANSNVAEPQFVTAAKADIAARLTEII